MAILIFEVHCESHSEPNSIHDDCAKFSLSLKVGFRIPEGYSIACSPGHNKGSKSSAVHFCTQTMFAISRDFLEHDYILLGRYLKKKKNATANKRN